MKSEQLKSQPEKKVAKPKKKKKNYVDPIRFKELILEYYDSDDFSEELGTMVNKISEHVAYMPNFINYTYRDEMISDSNYKMIRALNQKKYDPTKGNPFAYFTKITCRAFINVIKKEKRVEDTIGRYQTEMYDELSLTGLNIGNIVESMSDDYEYE
jgi:hypothetical protein